MAASAFQRCIAPACAAAFDTAEILFSCPRCGSLLDVCYDWNACHVPKSLRFFDERRGSGSMRHGNPDASGVWRFRELIPIAPVDELVAIGEGSTLFQQADELAAHVGLNTGRLFLQYEGFNPSGSFKDNGMAAAFTIARRLGRRRVACASTGNTSASMALFASHVATLYKRPMQAIVFVGGEKISLGKLAQALDYGATTLQVEGDFDACMSLVQEAADRLNLYLMNSLNPFRLEGQKSIIYRILEGLSWEIPDWIIVPGGNLGNTSAFGKALLELRELGLIPRIPRLAVINAEGANALYELHEVHGVRYNRGQWDVDRVSAYFSTLEREGRRAKTVASAIEIGRPVNLHRALRSLEAMNGVVRQVSDDAILDAKALVGRYGYGCEPAGAASIAGLQLLKSQQVIDRSDRVVCVLTGHLLKDPDAALDYHLVTDGDTNSRRFANPPHRVRPEIEEIASVLERIEKSLGNG